MTQPAYKTVELRRLITASPAEREELRNAYLDWLEEPDHEALQIRGKLFAPEGRQFGCCAIGGLLDVLADHGFARIDGNVATIRMNVPGQGVRDVQLGAYGMAGYGEADSYPDELVNETGLGLGLDLREISGLNDGPCAPMAFWKIAETIRGKQVELN